MTTYFPSSSNQRDVVPTLYVRDQTAASYSEAPVLPNNMMMYMNYSSAGSYSDTMTGNSQQHQSCVEIPSVGGSGLTTSHQGLLANLVGSHAGDPVYSAWRDGRNEMFMQPMGGPSTIQSLGVQMSGATDNLVHADVEDDPRMGLRPQLGILDGGRNLQGQGLSLSLSTQFSSAVPVPSFQFRHPNAGLSSLLGSHPTISGEGGSGTGSCRDDENSPNKQPRNADYLQPGFSGGNHDAVKQEAMNNLQCSLDPKQMHSSSSPYGMPGYMSTIPNSKYLKATQQLLDEVVNVRKALKQHEAEKHQGAGSKGLRESEGGSKDSSTLPSSSGMPTDSQEQTTTVELSPAERQDFQNRLTKLLSMLDEVDRRYRQYYHQMQIVVSSFDVIAGCGAAKPYTALALETISRHFRCLRDAISGQIKATRRSLGEKDTTGNSKGGGISRLRFVDQQLRQQRALQQLGMMQQHAWRPQRGLPESSVSILRAWLFEHFLHPYPKDSDKIMLARQTGLNRNQVSNWFINARVRLWKPMVEEMYKEEFGDIEMDSISSSENASKSARDDIKVSEDGREELQQNVKPSALERCESSQFHDSASNSIPDMEMSGSVTRTGFQNRSHGAVDMDYAGMRFRGNQNQNMDHSNLLQDTLVQSDGSGNGRFLSADAYHMAEMGRFGSGDGVSLTLGLQHCDGGGIPMSGGTHSNFVTMRGDEMYTAATSLGPDTTEYDCMDPDDRRHRFSSSHMMHDFVA